MLNGFINLYKEKNITSNKALSSLKFQLKQNNIITKVGHFGTLDPDAEGVLPVALGRATRLFDYNINKKKIYKASFEFGKETDTLDLSGKILKEEDVSIKSEDVLKVTDSFIGDIEQYPPKYSAKSVGGTRAYKLARKGVDFYLKPKTVHIYSVELINKSGHNQYEFRIICSGGTYIRAIARDMAYKMGTIGIMTELVREKSGYFDISESVKLSKLENSDISSYILPMDIVLKDYKRIDITKNQKKDLLDGKRIDYNNLSDGYFAVYSENQLAGIGHKDELGRLFIKTWLL
ncbi:MAG: tRNA pseudouridine(55) synthase TruB [Bacillota bacterium]